MPSLEDVAARGASAVARLRENAGPVDKLLYQEGPELLDLDSTPARVKQQIMGDVERITRILQLHRLWTWRIGRLILDARRTRHGKPVRILDVGAGGGGLLFRLADGARRRRIPVELIGLDLDAAHVERTRRLAGEEGRRVELRVGDARDLRDFADDSVDLAISTFTLHHLSAGDAARMLAELDRVAAVNFFAFDLRRNAAVLPALWALLRVGGFDAPSRHDSIVSVRRAYNLAEIHGLLDAAEVADFAVESVPPAFFIATRA